MAVSHHPFRKQIRTPFLCPMRPHVSIVKNAGHIPLMGREVNLAGQNLHFLKKQFIYFRLHRVLVVALGIFEQHMGCFLFVECWLSSCGSWAQSPHGIWDLNSLSRD